MQDSNWYVSKQTDLDHFGHYFQICPMTTKDKFVYDLKKISLIIFLCKSEQLKLLLATLDEPISTPSQEQDYGGKGGRPGVTSSHDAMMSANAQRLCAKEEAWDTEKKDLCKMATVPLNSCAHA